MDGWYSETKTAYQFHGCFFHGHSCTGKEVNEVNGKPMAELLAETRKNTVYLRHFVKVVELWECEWKETRRDPVVKKCLDAAFLRRRHARWTMTSQQILSSVRAGTVFGLIECDLCVPEALREHFAEMQPVFKNIRLTRIDLEPFMRRYAEKHNIMTTPRRMLVGSYRGDKILLAKPLLRWYMDHGLEVTHVYQIVEYDPIPCFRRFGNAVSTARREGDVHSHKAIIADTMKLQGNSGYGKTFTNVDRHRDVNYCTEKAASLMVNDRRFRQLDVVVDDVYEIEMKKKKVTFTLPAHDFINRYLERPLFQYCEMDTDSAYSVDALVTPELREHYFQHRSEWLPSECCDDHRNEYVRCRLANIPWVGDEACCKARRAYDKRTPDLFKVEWSGDGFVGLCSKTYYCFGSHLLLRQTRGARERGEHGSGGRVEKGDALWSSFISDHGRMVETSFHVHRRRTDGMRQKYFRDAYAASRCCDDRSTPRTDHVVLRGMARGLRNDGLGRLAVRGRVAEREHVRFVDEEPHRHIRSHDRNGRKGHNLVH